LRRQATQALAFILSERLDNRPLLDTETISHYELVFEGGIVDGRNESDVRSSFTKHFGESLAQRVFGATRTVLKKNLHHDAALKLQRQSRTLGMETTLSHEGPVATELSLVEEQQPANDDSAAESPVVEKPPEPGVVASRPRAPKVKQNKTIAPSEIDSSYSGEPGRPEKVSTAYCVHLGIVAVLMVLLPMVYISAMYAVAYGTWWHATNNFDLIESYLGVVWYAVPILGGGLITLFFLKPLVAGSSAREPQPVRLDPDKEPTIFHLVDSITEALGAPMPTEILVDADVNASASLRRGALSKDLTLTIGMPLFYGMRIEQLTGVLAHEFGHFAQQYGMRFATVIHYINYWFYRQAHMEDGWDDMIESWGESENLIGTLSAIFAKLGAFLVRLLLMLLAWFASMLSSGLSRHMEFDADQYQVELTGSSAYEDLARRMRVLAAGHVAANEMAAAGLTEGRLPDNIPTLAAEIAESFDETTRKKIIAEIEEVNSTVFDTHPPDLERMAAANKLNRAGVFRNDESALKLLRDPGRLGMHVTLQWYRAHGLEVEPKDLMTNSSFKASMQSA
jgi:Zn-dependent protease with chaperone function